MLPKSFNISLEISTLTVEKMAKSERRKGLYIERSLEIKPKLSHSSLWMNLPCPAASLNAFSNVCS